MIKELDYPSYANAGSFQRISWGAVFAGALTSLAVLAAMTSLGAGFGLVSGPTGRGLSISFATESAVWLLLSGVISSYAGGWMAGRLTGIARVSESVIHGVAAWSAATVALAFVFSPAFIGGLGWTGGMALGGSHPAFGGVIFDRLAAATAAGELGILGRFAFLSLVCNAAASAYGARGGTRVLRPIPMAEIRREHVGV
ncbi:MAG: hypothetical protein PHS14_10895 [Elusimicrobia bacterium]|nr:hypothetical protein [Elusimicrobiota bacterium]